LFLAFLSIDAEGLLVYDANNRGRLIRHRKVVDEWGNILEIKLWQVPTSTDKPHGFKYTLVYIVDGVRVIGYDNAERRGDHRHYGAREEAYAFVSLRQLIDDFRQDVADYRRRLL
jgi:hypothetical protein